MKPGTNFPSRLPDRQLHFARALWLALALLVVGIFLVNGWALYSDFQTPCSLTPALENENCLTPAELGELQARGMSPSFYAAYQVGLYVIFFLVFAGIALLIFWRRPDDRVALWMAFGLLVLGGGFPSTAATLHAWSPLFYAVMVAFNLLAGLCFDLFFFVFPNGRVVPGWAVWVVVGRFLVGLVPLLLPDTPVTLFLQNTHDVLVVLFFAIAIAAQLYRYRRVSNAVERQQTKWVLFGILSGLGGGILLLTAIYLFIPQRLESVINQMVFNPLLYLCFLLIPLSIDVAIVRARLYDIDLIIRRTLVYSVLSGLLALLYFGSVMFFQQLLRPFVGQGETPLVTVASTLALAAIFTPLHRRVQTLIDRRFYRRKYNAEQVLASFGETVRNETDLDRLTAGLIQVVEETMQPTQIALWLHRPVTTVHPGGAWLQEMK